MGLAAPRRKNKYDIDPRNNTWANDDNKFGQKLMEKFGWEKGGLHTIFGLKSSISRVRVSRRSIEF